MAGIAPPAMGIHEFVGFGKESTYGTALTGANLTAWMRPVSNGLVDKDPVIPCAGASGVMVRTVYNATTPRAFRGTPDISGPIVVEANYHDVGIWLCNAVGADDKTGPTDSVYTHTFTLTSGKPTAMPVSLTIGRIQGMGDAEDMLYAGGMLNNLELSGAPGRITTMTGDWLAQSRAGATDIDEDLAEVATAPWIEFHHSRFRIGAVAAGIGAGTIQGPTGSTGGTEPLDWTFRLENNLRAVQATGSGVRGIREPVYNGSRIATISINRDFFNDDMLDYAYAATVAGTFLSCELDLLGGTIGVSSNYQLSIYFPAAMIQYTEPAYGGGSGIMNEAVSFEAAYDGTNAPVTFQLKNETVAAY